jgi:hypothetical protein
MLLGVLLVLVSVLVGARVLSAADRSTLVYAVSKDLTAGSVLQAGDLRQVRVRLFDNADRYIAVGSDPISGYVVRRAISSGELLPRAALSVPQKEVDFRSVTVAVESGHYPHELARDQQVDVWVTPDLDGGQDAPTAGGAAQEPGAAVPAQARGQRLELRGAQLVLQGVTVLDVAREGGGFGGSVAVPVELQVRPDEVATLVSAMALGTIDLVKVPREAESSGRLAPAVGSD